MKCVLVVLAAVLFFCSFNTCATAATDIRKGSLPNMYMRSNKLQEALPASTDSVTVDLTVTGTEDKKVAVTVTVVSTGAGAGTFNGAVSFTNAGTDSFEVNFPSPSGNVKSVTGKITITGTVTAKDTFKGSGTLKGATTGAVSITGDVTGSVTVTKENANANTVTVSGTVAIAKKTQVKPPTESGTGGGSSTPAGPKSPEPKLPALKETTTEAPEPTTTSTAAPTDAPQQSTDKPTNPTEGKTDSSTSHVASHVALFIGTITLLSVV